jgi:hypothetical protein
MAEPSHAWKDADMGEIQNSFAAVSAAATQDHPYLDGGGESRLKNPLREICTAGSVREETFGKPRWT